MATAAEKLKEALGLIESGTKMIAHSSDWYTGQMQMMVEMLFERFAPWKPGDRVRLVREINFVNSYGWKGAEHWLKPGVVGTVHSVDAHNKRFTALVEWDNQTYLDYRTGEALPVDRPGCYNMGENDIEKVSS
jgi:hypothetical protein